MPNNTGQPGTDDIDALTYEDAVEQLEAIIARVESGEVGIEESIRLYERGTHLLRRCRAVLDQAEQRIEQLGETSDTKA